MAKETLTILQLNDKMLTANLDKAGFRKIGVNIKSASTFQEAEEALKSGVIDVIVVNDDYKDINGLAILEHFKSQPSTAHIPFVFTSVRSKPAKYKELVKAGLDLFVEQPVPRDYFIEKLRALLDQKTRDDNRLGFDGLVQFVLNDRDYKCEIKDLSKTGLLLGTSEALPIESEIQMSFQLPGYKKPIKAKGVVIRDIAQEEHFAYGVRFKEFDGDSQKRLEKYISKNDDDPRMAYYL